MVRLFNIVLIVSSITLVALLVFIFLENLNILRLFPFVVLSLMLTIAAFVLKLFIRNNELPKFIRWGVIIFCLIPLSVPLFGLIDPFQVEENWPLMISGLVFYAGLGLLSISGIFMRQNKPPLISRIFLVLFSLLLFVWFVFILLNISDSQLYNYTSIFGVTASILYLIPLTISLLKRG